MAIEINRQEIVEQIGNIRIIPLTALDTVADGLKVCESLCNAGLKTVEVTFRTEAAEETIREASNAFPDMLVGAGTILNVGDLERAANAGAKFAVAPGCNPKVVKKANEIGLPFFPGITNPTDIECAYDGLGCDVLKFFPAEAVGGVKLLKSMIAPYKHLGIRFIPTGGINADNYSSYLELNEVLAVGGTWIVPKDAVKNKEWQIIVDKAKEVLS